ncbi:MAG TPA: archaeosortase A [Methanocorpusculum sp.]|nr:archaeosortase A [Methanocorpusculum sp.]
MEIYSIIPFIIALIAFILFFIPTKMKKYFGILGWSALIIALITLLPHLIEVEGNVFYPIIIILVILLLIPTIRLLLKENPHINTFTVGVGVATIIYAPFEIISPLGNWLIETVVFWVQKFFDAVNFPYQMYSWNFFESLVPITRGYLDQIILGCTGITAIAILIGVIFLTKTTIIRKIGLIIIATVPIYIINIFRNVFVIMAYFYQWFPWCEEWFLGNTIPGFASYFWSHNIMCEGAAFLVIIIIAILLFKFTPGLVSTIRNIIDAYITDIRELTRRK